MRMFLNGLLLGLIVGAGTLWFYGSSDTFSSAQEAERRAAILAEKGLESAQRAAERAQQALAGKLEALELRLEDVEKELVESGRVVRRRARDLGAGAVEAAVDARIVATIKAKLAADRELSALAISVDSTAGRVTLAGSVSSPELVGRAMALALETEDVREVVSTLKVKRAAGPQGWRAPRMIVWA